MDTPASSLEALKDIRQIMERSGRFISLSGWSGVAAGCWALAGAVVARTQLAVYPENGGIQEIVSRGIRRYRAEGSWELSDLYVRFIVLGACIFAGALGSAFLFTWLRSRREGVTIWGPSARRLLWNTMLPMLAGGVLVLRLIYLDAVGLIAPTCLLFYGLALVNGSKYTLGEVRYLGYGQIILGAINCWVPRYGLYFWAAGFGVLHIVYGIWMWRKYEKSDREPQ